MRVTGERKRVLYHSATADVRESAKRNDDGTTERVKSPATRVTMTMTIEYHYHSYASIASFVSLRPPEPALDPAPSLFLPLRPLLLVRQHASLRLGLL